MIAPVGPACRVRIWRRHEWRDWFLATEATLGKVSDSAIMRKWKWWFVNGWKFKSLSWNATEFLNPWRRGICEWVCLGTALKNNISVVRMRCTESCNDSHLMCVRWRALLIEHIGISVRSNLKNHHICPYSLLPDVIQCVYWGYLSVRPIIVSVLIALNFRIKNNCIKLLDFKRCNYIYNHVDWVTLWGYFLQI
jgi:hypothetical protein